MAFASLEASDDNEPLTEINMVPLIDVMLVLLIIFMVTAPLLTHAVKVDLPKAASGPNITRPDNVQLAIDRGGQMYWNGAAVDTAQFVARAKATAALEPQPELHIRADRETRYQVLADVMAEAQRVKLQRVGFITDPA